MSGHARHSGAVYLETFGCQMNELDSELVRGQLTALGYRFVDDDREADVILYNTCSVREHAESKVYSRIGVIGKRKAAGVQVVLGVIGCMAERDGVAMMRRHPQIDVLCGPGELDRLPLLIENAFKTERVALEERVALQGNRSRRAGTLSAAADNLELLDLSRAFDPDRAPAGGRTAYVRITRGCNKFCTYCVVPNTRGAEVHRPPDHIVEECRRLAEQGVREITLLGQTVNHYLYVHGAAVTVDGREAPQVGPGLGAFRELSGQRSAGEEGLPDRSGRSADDRGGARTGLRTAAGRRVTTFAELLRRIHDEVPEIGRLRFVTSYPRDFGDDVLEVIAASPRICRYLHLPPQSGSDRILRLMNRGYSVDEYLGVIDRARAFLPDVGLSGDIIVGFPTETEEDFQVTVALLERVRFKSCFIFKYSPRPGTAAIDRYPDDVPDEVKRRRNNELLAVQSRISESVHREWIGRTVDVFVEQVGQRRRSSPPAGGGRVELRWERRGGDGLDGREQAGSDASAEGGREAPTQLIGRTSQDMIVAFDVAAPDLRAWLGATVSVAIDGASPLLLSGRCVRDPFGASVVGAERGAAFGKVSVGRAAVAAGARG